VVATAQGQPGARRVFEAKAQDFSLDEIALFGGLRNCRSTATRPYRRNCGSRWRERPCRRGERGITIGAGYFRLDEPDFEPVMIQSISGARALDRKNRQFMISPIKSGRARWI